MHENLTSTHSYIAYLHCLYIVIYIYIIYNLYVLCACISLYACMSALIQIVDINCVIMKEY